MAKASTSFKPGQSGNPRGRPKKGHTLTDLIAEKLDKKRFVEELCSLSYTGDITAIKEVLNRVDGKVQEKVLIEGSLSSIIARMPPDEARAYLEEHFGDIGSEES